MATRGPWSVKGIDSKAREAALHAARSEGLTLGDYLNRLLLEAEAEAESGGSANAPSGTANQGAAPEPHQPTGIMALDQLAKRIEATEARSSLAISNVDHSVNALISRLENAEKSQSAIEGRVDMASDELREAQDYLKRRIDRMEADDSSHQNLRALKSLENAIERLAGRVEETRSASEASRTGLTERLDSVDSQLSSVNESVDAKVADLHASVESTMEKAAAQVEKAVTEAELRTEGAARHLSERLSTVEQNLSLASRGVNDRIAKIETNMGSTLAQVTEGVERFGRNVAASEERSVQAFDLVAKLDEQSRQQREEVDGKLTSVDEALAEISSRLSRAETETDTALAGLESTFGQLEERMVRFETEFADEEIAGIRKHFEDKFDALRQELSETVKETRDELAEQIEATATVSTEAFSEMNTAVSEISKRLRRNEMRQTQAVEAVGEEVAKFAETLESRVRTVESRNESELSGAMRDQITALAETFHKRIAEIENRADPAVGSLDAMSEKLNEMAEALNARVEASEERSAAAIRDFTEHVTTLTKNLSARQEEGLNRISGEMKDAESRQRENVDRAMNKVSARIAQVEQATSSSISPIQRAMSSLAERLQSVEEFSNPNGTSKPMDPLAFDSFDAKLTPADGVDDFDASPEPPAPKPEAKTEPEAKSKPAAPAMDFPDIPEPDEMAAPPKPAKTSDPKDPWADDEPFVAGDGFKGEELDSDEFGSDLPDTRFDLDAAEFDHDKMPDDGFDPVADSTSGMDYLSRARAAAQAAQDPKKSRTAPKNNLKSGSSSKLPLIAAASMLALTAAGTAGYLLMRGKQDNGLSYVDGNQNGQIGQNAVIVPDPTGVPMPEAGEGEDSLLSGELASPDMSSDPSGETILPVEDAEPETVEAVKHVAAETPEPRVETPAVVDVPEVTSSAPTPEEMAADSSATRSLNQAQINSAIAIPPQSRPVSQPVRQPVAQPVNAAPAVPAPVASYLSGVELLETGRIADGATLMREAADAGLPIAQYRMAKLYENGQGVPRDLSQSRAWTARAAEGGNIKAMHDLAVFYAEGEGGQQNYAGAVQWFRNAAEYGLIDSQYNLGVLYEQGLGVTADPEEALYWFMVAQKSGDQGAGPKISEMSSQLDPAVVSQVRARADVYVPLPGNDQANGRFPASLSGAAPAGQAQVASQPVDGRTALIRDAQTLLDELGYNVGVADGQFGNRTLNAILAFQSSNGYPQSGQVTPTLIRQLEAALDDSTF